MTWQAILWLVASFALPAIVSALAKKAQANAEAARISRGGAPAAAGPKASATASAPSTPGGTPEAKPRVLARGQSRPKQPRAAAPTQRGGTAAGDKLVRPKPQPVNRPPAPSAPVPAVARTEPRGGDSAAAMQSRQHLVDSIARVRAAQARAAGLPNVDIRPAQVEVRARPAFVASDLARALRDPAKVRQAFVLGEVLGRPRADQPA
jgi:hypothetical protein